jgi:hypothetical protein
LILSLNELLFLNITSQMLFYFTLNTTQILTISKNYYLKLDLKQGIETNIYSYTKMLHAQKTYVRVRPGDMIYED